ncbi:MAG: MFS transporter, partial [Lactobacillus sp.]
MGESKKKSVLGCLGFSQKRQLTAYLAVVFTGQIIYDAFDAFKGAFYNVLLKMLHLNNAQLGAVFSLIGITVLFYIPAGWVNNRFSAKAILIITMMVRMFTTLIVIFLNPSYTVLKIIAAIWGINNSVFWPAILNAVNLLTDKKHKAVAFGVMESLRRLTEMVCNMLVVAAMT